MTIAFTICSNNYLAHAKTLGDSYLKHHPLDKFVIGLVDRPAANFDYAFFKDFEIIPVDDIEIKEFPELLEKYNITELNTAVKPSYIHHLFKKYNAAKLLYIDPDILVTSPFEEVISILDSSNIVLTPHLLSPIDDEYAPTDYHTLRGGIFNLGFIGLSNYNKIEPFIKWWHERVIKYGFADFSKNMFYDQLWVNYVPCFFDSFHILKHPGYNMANWNLHERFIEDNSNNYTVNGEFPLRFFHFSSYKFSNPNVICSYLTRYSFEDRKDLISIFDTYHKYLIKNRVEEIFKLPVYYYPALHSSFKHGKKNIIEKITLRIKKSVKVLLKGSL